MLRNLFYVVLTAALLIAALYYLVNINQHGVEIFMVCVFLVMLLFYFLFRLFDRWRYRNMGNWFHLFLLLIILAGCIEGGYQFEEVRFYLANGDTAIYENCYGGIKDGIFYLVIPGTNEQMIYYSIPMKEVESFTLRFAKDKNNRNISRRMNYENY